MENTVGIIAVLLFLILWALWWGLAGIIEAIKSSSHRSTDLSGIEAKLEGIYDILGGKAEGEKHQKELKARLIRLEMSVNKMTQKEAQAEADKLFEEADFEETHEYTSLKFDSIQKWVTKTEIEERNNNKYGHLLDKMRGYLKDKPMIPAYDSHGEMAKALGTEYNGVTWLIKKMLQEGRLKKVEEYKDDYNQLKHYEVLEPVNQP